MEELDLWYVEGHWLNLHPPSFFFGVMARTPRKPHGFGRQAVQAKKRKELAKKVSDLILHVLDLESVERNGVLFPRRLDLRRVKNRRFATLQHVHGRVFTKRFCLGVVRNVVASLPFSLTKDPKLSVEDHLLAQARRLQTLAKKSKRLGAKTKMADDMDTQPYDSRLSILNGHS